MIRLINKLEKKIKNPNKGLPEDFFKFITRVTPMINVDLLIVNSKSEILLTWRNKGEKYKPGWHVPGGIIRYKEKIHQRIKKVAKKELGVSIYLEKKPIEINEIFLNQKNRAHFISILYLCRLKSKLLKLQKFKSGNPVVGNWKWHKSVPRNFIKPHYIYKKFFKKRYILKKNRIVITD